MTLMNETLNETLKVVRAVKTMNEAVGAIGAIWETIRQSIYSPNSQVSEALKTIWETMYETLKGTVNVSWRVQN